MPGPAAPSAKVFITAELDRRIPRKADYLKEKQALLDLAARMADQPQEVLPRFVALAMEMTGGSSAGVSLYEDLPVPGVFRWQYLHGAFATFDGATTPRHFSPCGVTLDLNAPVLSTYPERIYDWIAAANIVVPEVLLVPLYIGGAVPLGTLWIVADEVGHFDKGHARVAMELASFVGTALGMLRTQQDLRRMLDEQRTLAQEMSHRVKNLFALADGLVRISARGAVSKEQMARDISGRLHALAEAHALVQRAPDELETSTTAIDLPALVLAILRPHDDPGGGAKRFAIEGPPLLCAEREMNGIALILHELATNAAKHGALKGVDGRLDVSWRRADDTIILTWCEHGVRLVEPPTMAGFGSTLMQKMIGQLNGRIHHDWRPSGLTVTLTLPADVFV